jgi:hypothetical protein
MRLQQGQGSVKAIARARPLAESATQRALQEFLRNASSSSHWI